MNLGCLTLKEKWYFLFIKLTGAYTLEIKKIIMIKVIKDPSTKKSQIIKRLLQRVDRNIPGKED